jgi:2-(3-amino-3-carboxypropyl)histidine synthase
MNFMRKMKILYVEAQKKPTENINLDICINELPKEIFLSYSIQFKKIAEKIKEELEKRKIKILGFRHVLGCTKLNINKNTPILLVGSGRFHALNMALQGYEVYIYNNSMLNKITKEDIKKLKENRQAAINNFLHSSSIGILVSTKPGQQNLRKAQEIKKKIEKKYPEKNTSIFISNNINTGELENFQIDAWINTACPGLANDSKKIINSEDLLNLGTL